MLLAQLKDSSDMIGRLLAAEALGQRKTEDSVAALHVALVGDPFYGVRSEAAAALQTIGTDQALAALAESLEQTDARVRLAVVEAIGSFYSDRARDLLVRVTREEKNQAIVGAALRALGKYHDQAIDQLLRSFLKSDSFRNELVGAAVDAIARGRSADFVTDLTRLLDEREDDLTSQGIGQTFAALAAIGRDRPEAAAVRNRLLTYLQHPRRRIRVAAARELGQLGDGGARAALAGLADSQRHDRLAEAAREALKTLDKRQPDAPEELSQFRQQLRSLREDQQKLQEELKQLKSQQKAGLE
jgi:aminopeptidase N